MAQSPRASATQPCKLFIGGLSYDTTDASLLKYFSKFGQVASAVVLRDQTSSRSRGFGFVTFCTLKAANSAVDCKQHLVDGRRVEAKFAVPRVPSRQTNGNNGSSNNDMNERPSSSNGNNQMNNTSSMGKNGPSSRFTQDNRESSSASTASYGSVNSCDQVPDSNGIIINKIFVGGLLYATGHDSLRQYFENFGQVVTAEVIYNRDTKKSRGFGFVVFKEKSSVQDVIDTQENSTLVIDGKQVEVKQCFARAPSTSSAGTPSTNSGKTIENNANTQPQGGNSSFQIQTNFSPQAGPISPWLQAPTLDTMNNSNFDIPQSVNNSDKLKTNDQKLPASAQPNRKIDPIGSPLHKSGSSHQFFPKQPTLARAISAPESGNILSPTIGPHSDFDFTSFRKPYGEQSNSGKFVDTTNNDFGRPGNRSGSTASAGSGIFVSELEAAGVASLEPMSPSSRSCYLPSPHLGHLQRRDRSNTEVNGLSDRRSLHTSASFTLGSRTQHQQYSNNPGFMSPTSVGNISPHTGFFDHNLLSPRPIADTTVHQPLEHSLRNSFSGDSGALDSALFPSKDARPHSYSGSSVSTSSTGNTAVVATSLTESPTNELLGHAAAAVCAPQYQVNEFSRDVVNNENANAVWSNFSDNTGIDMAPLSLALNAKSTPRSNNNEKSFFSDN